MMPSRLGVVSGQRQTFFYRTLEIHMIAVFVTIFQELFSLLNIDTTWGQNLHQYHWCDVVRLKVSRCDCHRGPPLYDVTTLPHLINNVLVVAQYYQATEWALLAPQYYLATKHTQRAVSRGDSLSTSRLLSSTPATTPRCVRHGELNTVLPARIEPGTFYMGVVHPTTQPCPLRHQLLCHCPCGL